MENFKEFQGKDLDDCIDQARVFYDCPREKLEIEIIQDAKSGIFGIVGARKARIRARRVKVAESVQNLFESRERPEAEESRRKTRADAPRPAKQKKTPARPPKTRDDVEDSPDDAASATPSPQRQEDALDVAAEESTGKTFAELDKDAMAAAAIEIVGRLIKPIAGRDAPLEAEIIPGAARVKVEWDGDAGPLIGREGQTLAAIQYIASRIASKTMNGPVKVRLDIGNYRGQQEEKLCGMARSLAEKAVSEGRTFSTPPLSSYHRRLVHLCLQENGDIQTRSSGDGPFKKVLIFPKKNGRF